MILGIGLEMADIPTCQEWSEGIGDEFEGVFAPNELEYACKKRKSGDHLAARYAAKRALLKAVGQKPNPDLILHQIWIERAASGKPSLHLSPEMRGKLLIQPADRLHVTLSHTGEVAVALVVWERI